MTSLDETQYLDAQDVPSGCMRSWTWMPSVPCVLVDVRLVDVFRALDIDHVQVGNRTLAAFAKKRPLVNVNEQVRIVVKNYGQAYGRCAVEIAYRPLGATSGR